MSFVASSQHNTRAKQAQSPSISSIQSSLIMSSQLKFSIVSKAHGLTAMLFGVIFLFATFGMSLPMIGPAALLDGWDDANQSLMYLTRFLSGVLFGLGYFEYELSDHEFSRKIYVRYHIVLLILVVYSTFGAAVSGLSWLYAALVALFLAGGVAGNEEGYTAI